MPLISSVIIGSGTLPVQCAILLHQAGHQVLRVISPDAPLQEWAASQGIPHADLKVDLVAWFSRESFDYLFSIINPRILPAEVLALPRQGAINYHDAPLPRYAGTHATSWALINQEQRHAVSWHEMDVKVDAGDILRQVWVDIAPGETALTLNAKCYDAAIQAFAVLVGQLANDSLTPWKQDLGQRTYFPRHKRPSAAATIDWNRPASEIGALVRALDFGTYPNPLGLPKLAATDEDFLLVRELAVLPSSTSAPPGTITHIDKQAIHVATGTDDVALCQLAMPRGQPLALAEAVARYGWYEGHRMPRLTPETVARIDTLNALASKAEVFWRKRLVSLQPAVIPYANLEAVEVAYDGGDYERISAPGPDSVQALLAERDWDTRAFMLAAFAAYVGRLSSLPTVDIGFTEAGLQQELAGLTALFSQQLPLRLTWGEGRAMVDVLPELQAELALVRQQKTYAHDVVLRHPSLRNGQIALSVAAVFGSDERLIPPEPGNLLVCYLGPGPSEITWLYHPGAFDRPLIEGMLGQFVHFLEEIAAAPEQPLAACSLLSTSAQAHLADLNQTRQSFAPVRCLHELFAEQVVRTPEAVAVVFEDQQLTYQELDARTNQLAHQLQSLGVGPEVVVGIFIERSLEMVVALLGVLKAGGAYLPLDPSYPPERLAFMLADAQVPVLLTKTTLASALPQRAASLLYLDEWSAAGWPADPVASCVQPENPAYIIYTSGSTGRPKGVVVEHRQLYNYLRAICETYGLPAGANYAMVQSLAFDFVQTVLLPALFAGGTLHVISETRALDAEGLADYLECHKIDVLKLVPTHLRALQAAVSPDRLLPRQFLILGGEASNRVWAEELAAMTTCRVFNHYGPTETTVGVLTYQVQPKQGDLTTATVPIGRPFPNTTAYVLDPSQQPVPIGVPGELYIGGLGVTRGYLNQPGLTADRFVPDPFTTDPGARMYRTGDLARVLLNGNKQPIVEFLGRIDDQVKIRGYRIELGEIEAVLNQQPEVQTALVLARENAQGYAQLVAYVVPDTAAPLTVAQLRDRLKAHLPAYMVPDAIILLEALPRMPHGKVDRRALPDPETASATLATTEAIPTTPIEQTLVDIWKGLLKLDKIGIDDNYFDLGSDSLLLIQALSQIRVRIPEAAISIVDLFQYPTVRLLAQHLRPESVNAQPQPRAARDQRAVVAEQDVIAIIGMAGRFPGARDLDEFWQNIQAGVESISRFTEAELIEAGVDPEALRRPGYVRARGITADFDCFDATFFGYTPREASIIDPQQRLFLETAWHALEDAGYDPARYAGRIGVFGGMGRAYYLIRNLYPNRRLIDLMGVRQIGISNDKDFLTTRVSYKLGLRGPSLNVQTACSTSLVATHLARQSLLNGDCDMALAGGITLPIQNEGYLYKEGDIHAPDGHCRPFDAQAQGTVPSSGVGIVVLKRLKDALTDGDTIRALILGSAINNDGAVKVGYMAPSVAGQAQVITDALRSAGVEARAIDYVETHGTATVLGDPIEIQGLTQAYRQFTDEKRFCALGSVKSNIGHADAAAGVAGLIKTTQALEKQSIPPSLHFERANPEIIFDASPFYVNTELTPWPADAVSPRRAGVSSFGIGGTNAHVILEEAPSQPLSDPARPWQLLLLSAKTEAALSQITANLAAYLRRHEDVNLADVAYTLQVGRAEFAHRRGLVCRDAVEAAEALATIDPRQVTTGTADSNNQRPIVFMFTGQGAQYVNMARDLYEAEPTFRQHVDHCCGLLQAHLGFDLRSYLYPEADADLEAVDKQLRQTAVTQPALFVIEYALAQLWQSWGLVPRAMIGHSIGEYVAACLASVLTLDDALALVTTRGRLMQRLPGGSMLAVFLPEAELRPLLGEALSLAGVNAPNLSVVSGPNAAIERLADELAERKVEYRRLRTSHAFHSAMMDPILDTFAGEVAKFTLHPPQIPFVSNVTGTWITAAEATDPHYWARHMRQGVRFSDGVQTLLSLDDPILLEVGPGRTLSELARQNLPAGQETLVLHSVRHPRDQQSDYRFLLHTLGRLWIAGVSVDWSGFYAGVQRRRLPLPTYPFEKQRHWVEPNREAASSTTAPALSTSTEVAPSVVFMSKQADSLPASIEAPAERARRATQNRFDRNVLVGADLLEGELKQRVVEIWQELMGIEQIGPHENFFDLGGHSFLAVNIIDQVEKQFGKRISANSVFEAPTIERFTRLLRRELGIEQNGWRKRVRILWSFAQKRLLSNRDNRPRR